MDAVLAPSWAAAGQESAGKSLSPVFMQARNRKLQQKWNCSKLEDTPTPLANPHIDPPPVAIFIIQ